MQATETIPDRSLKAVARLIYVEPIDKPFYRVEILRAGGLVTTLEGQANELDAVIELVNSYRNGNMACDWVCSSEFTTTKASPEAITGVRLIAQNRPLKPGNEYRFADEVEAAIKDGLAFDADPYWSMSDDCHCRQKASLTKAGAELARRMEWVKAA